MAQKKQPEMRTIRDDIKPPNEESKHLYFALNAQVSALYFDG